MYSWNIFRKKRQQKLWKLLKRLWRQQLRRSQVHLFCHILYNIKTAKTDISQRSPWRQRAVLRFQWKPSLTHLLLQWLKLLQSRTTFARISLNPLVPLVIVWLRLNRLETFAVYQTPRAQICWFCSRRLKLLIPHFQSSFEVRPRLQMAKWGEGDPRYFESNPSGLTSKNRPFCTLTDRFLNSGGLLKRDLMPPMSTIGIGLRRMQIPGQRQRSRFE